MKEKIEYAARAAGIEERSADIIPAEIRKAVEEANATQVVDPPNMEKRGGPRVLHYKRPL